MRSFLERLEQLPSEQRSYALARLAQHIYDAQEWSRLFECLDNVEYGRAKIAYDPSMRAFSQDLDLGRQAAKLGGRTVEEGITLLPHLWQYTLLRCGLTSYADECPEAAFQLLILRGRKQEALGLAELLTDQKNNARILLKIAEQLRDQGSRAFEWLEVLIKAGEVALTIEDEYQQAPLLVALVTTLVHAQQWERAQAMIHKIKMTYIRVEELANLGAALAHSGQWEQAQTIWAQAEAVILTINDSLDLGFAPTRLLEVLIQEQRWEHAEALICNIQNSKPSFSADNAKEKLVKGLIHARRWEQAHAVILSLKYHRSRDLELINLGVALVHAQKWELAREIILSSNTNSDREKGLVELGTALARSQKWEQAIEVLPSIESSWNKATAQRNIALAFAQNQQWEQAEVLIHSIGKLYPYERAEALTGLGTALAQAQQWDRAEVLIRTREYTGAVTEELGKALVQAQQWDRAARVIRLIVDGEMRAKALVDLGMAFTHTQQWDRAKAIWAEVETLIPLLMQHRILELWCILGIALANAQQWEQVEILWKEVVAIIQHKLAANSTIMVAGDN
jgi:tetratricopeptide (TPR) repeat protein